MKKFLLRRIGVASNETIARPSLADCMEIVLAQTDALIGDVLEGLTASAIRSGTSRSAHDMSPANHWPYSNSMPAPGLFETPLRQSCGRRFFMAEPRTLRNRRWCVLRTFNFSTPVKSMKASSLRLRSKRSSGCGRCIASFFCSRQRVAGVDHRSGAPGIR